MRSRTSRGVPEWSGGKDLYIGSPISAIGTSFGVIGIVPGPPEGPRGPTGWGHLSRRVPWAEVRRDPAQSGLGRHFPWGPCAWGEGGTLRKSPKEGRHLLGALGGRETSLAAPFLGGR